MNKLYSKKEINNIFEREQGRSDRTSREFSIIIVKTGKSLARNRLPEKLVSLLVSRIRCYDYIGLLDPARIAIIIPETSFEGATKLADDISDIMSKQYSDVNYSIYTYPFNWVKGNTIPDDLPLNDSSENNIGSSSNNGNKNSSFDNLKPLMPKKIPLWKRILDIIIGLSALTVLSPVMFILSVYIKD